MKELQKERVNKVIAKLTQWGCLADLTYSEKLQIITDLDFIASQSVEDFKREINKITI
tara:strand:- start:265 stop:438 length:174 start_codon:yes stop_codon:yes gene_type:complete